MAHRRETPRRQKDQDQMIAYQMTEEELRAHEAAIAEREAFEADNVLRDLPDAAEIAETIQAILDPACDAEERHELVQNLEAYGRMHLTSYGSAGALTNNKGFYLCIGPVRFAVSVHD